MHARHSKLAVFARAAEAAMLLFVSACGSGDPGGGGAGADQGGAASGSTGTSGGSNPQTTGSSTAAGAGSGGSGPTSSENTGGVGGSNSESGSGAGGSANPVTMGNVFGPVHTGSYNNGPVDFSESVYHNACAPKEKYAPQIQELYGPYLGGVDNSLAGDGSLCDTCALLTTRLGKSVLVHLVTYGVSKAPGDMDLSPAAYDAVYESDPMGTPSIPRPMSWQLARCPDAGNIYLQFQTLANPYWTSFWVRNAQLPIVRVESKAGEGAFEKLDRSSDGPFTDANGVGSSTFELRITASDGQVLMQTMSGFVAGAIVATSSQFK